MIIHVHAKETIYPDTPMVNDFFFEVDTAITDPLNLISVLRDGIKEKYNVNKLGDYEDADPVLFGRELKTIDPDYFAKHGIRLLTFPCINVDWDTGEPIRRK